MSFMLLAQPPAAKVLTDLAVMLKCFGVGTSYLIVIGDVMPDSCRTFLCPADNLHCELDFPLSLIPRLPGIALRVFLVDLYPPHI